MDDLIVGLDGKVSTAVISVGGFLGIGGKLVRVPYGQLRFEERNLNETAAAGAPSGVARPIAPGSAGGNIPAGTLPPVAIPGPHVTATRIVLPGATKESLTSMPRFSHGG